MGEHSEFWLSLYICTYLKLMRTSFVYVSTTDNPGVLVYSLVLHTVKFKKKITKKDKLFTHIKLILIRKYVNGFYNLQE